MDYAQKLNLTGKTALVTGAGQGIGAACAKALASTGAEVICTDLSAERAEKTAADLREKGWKAQARALDVTDSAGLATVASALPALDILVCNAGIAHNVPAEDMTDEDWERMIGVNLSGVFKTCRAFGGPMIKAGRGAIVNIGSMSGQIVNTPQPQCHYNAAKAGVHHLTKSLAVEWAAHGVRVNAVAPTYIATPLLDGVKTDGDMITTWKEMTPMKRLGEPHEVASAVQFLASDAASLITGSILNVDGGYICL